jgi:hypothetical protein
MNYIFVHLLDIKMFKSLIDARYKHEERRNRFLFHSCSHVTGRHIDIVRLQRLLHYYRRPIILHFTYEHAHSVSHRLVALSKRPQPPFSKIELTAKGFFTTQLTFGCC